MDDNNKIKVEFIGYWKDWGIIYLNGGCKCVMEIDAFNERYRIKEPNEQSKDAKKTK